MSYTPEHEPSPIAPPSASGGPDPAAAPTAPASPGGARNPGMVIAIVWAVFAVLIGIAVMVDAQPASYGGDAYTDVQRMGAQIVRALGWLIISTGPLGLIIAASRR